MFMFLYRKNADVQMEGQFLVRQIYEDELTYNLISAAVEVLSEFSANIYIKADIELNWDVFIEIPANTILELFGKMFFWILPRFWLRQNFTSLGRHTTGLSTSTINRLIYVQLNYLNSISI